MENCHEMEKAPEIFPETFFEAALTAAFADVPGLFHGSGEPEGTGEQKNPSEKNKADGSSGAKGRGEGKRKEAEQKVLPGEKIIIAGYAGESGACAIAEKKKEILLRRFSPRYLDMSFLRQDLALIQEAQRILTEMGCTVVPAGNGGVFAALFTLSKRFSIGFTVELKRIPIRQQTIEIMNVLGGNPYELYAKGVLIACTADDGPVLRALKAAGVPCGVCGYTQKGVKKILLRGEEERYLERPKKNFVLHEEYAG